MDESQVYTHVIFASEARKKLLDGAKIVATAVGSTLGPKGKCCLITNGNKSPINTKDGYTVAKSINLRDPVEFMGADLVKQAATSANETAGDGTTTTSVLSLAMMQEGFKLSDVGFDTIEICNGIEEAVSSVVNEITNTAKKLSTNNEVLQIATISANGDKKIGMLVAEAIRNVGVNGIVSVEDAKSTETTLSVVDGLMFDRGYLSPYFVTNNERMNVSYDDAYVLIADKKISTMKEIVPILEIISRAQKSLVIIADEIEGEALQTLVVNKLKTGLRVVAVKAPGYGQHKIELLDDMCVLTGAKLVSPTTGISIDKIGLSDLGKCNKITVDAKTTTIVGINNDTTKERVKARLEDLNEQLTDVTLSPEESTKLRIRIAKLSSGVAVIRVGGLTELEVVEKKYRLEDALNATRAAVESGITPGGGIRLYRCSNSLTVPERTRTRDEEAGVELVRKACKAPLRKIVENAGVSFDVIDARLKNEQFGIGYNAATGEYVDMIDNGIVDPAKVAITAIKNAASVAITFLSLDAVVYDAP